MYLYSVCVCAVLWLHWYHMIHVLHARHLVFKTCRIKKKNVYQAKYFRLFRCAYVFVGIVFCIPTLNTKVCSIASTFGCKFIEKFNLWKSSLVIYVYLCVCVFSLVLIILSQIIPFFNELNFSFSYCKSSTCDDEFPKNALPEGVRGENEWFLCEIYIFRVIYEKLEAYVP